MSIPLHRRLLQAAGLGDATQNGAGKLMEVTAQIQRALGKRGVSGAELPPRAAADGAEAPFPHVAGIPGGLDLLDRLKIPGLDILRRPEGNPAGTMISRGFASPEGTRPYKVYAPKTLARQAPLLVMLHGCTQTAEDFAAGTRMNELAEAQGFVVLYPEQISSANAQRCWNWFNPGDQRRGLGEPALIAGMTEAVREEFGADPRRVFVAGLSAGGAQAAILGAAYPEIFAAVGVHSGLACGAAHDMSSAFAAMRQGKPGQGSLTVPVIIFHGDRDSTVNPRNADEVAALAASGQSVRTEEGRAEGGLAYTRTVRLNWWGRPVLEQWAVHGAGHAWSGGSSKGSYTEPRGPDASREMLRFFLQA
jgi:poly(hydroxyalkanoate) depolymerase family esterase